jgi:hypothetical protein
MADEDEDEDDALAAGWSVAALLIGATVFLVIFF